MSKSNAAPDLSGFVNASGQRIAFDPQSPSFKAKTPKPVRESKAAYHKGFSVVGYPPGMIGEAKAHAEKRRAEWFAQAPETMAAQISQGRREPQSFDRAAWLSRTKPKKVRNRPFEIPAAADECAELARRQGWEEVRVEAQAKGEAQELGLS